MQHIRIFYISAENMNSLAVEQARKELAECKIDVVSVTPGMGVDEVVIAVRGTKKQAVLARDTVWGINSGMYCVIS
jgi:glycerol-3-phosphate responsive antiterminator